MKKLLLSAACVAAFGAAPALAQDEGSTSAWGISGTFGVVSDYVFRGISQTQGDAAIQASATVSHESGAYFTVWGSNVDFNDGETDFEVDFTLGYGGSINDSTTYDVNVTYYAYPNSPSGADYDYFELIGGITHDLGNGLSFGAKVAYSPANFGDTGSAFWIGGNATYAATEWLAISANLGMQSLDDSFYAEDSYFHYDIGATVTYGILNLDVRYVATDSDVINDDKVVGSAIFTF
jgi:uncharacterized protein (TIGR02001 family)